MSIEDVEKRVDKFNGHDFSLWRSQIEDYLNMKRLAKTLNGMLPKGMEEEDCAENGIRMEKTIPGTPQQNGAAERMNRTLNERARSMRIRRFPRSWRV